MRNFNPKKTQKKTAPRSTAYSPSSGPLFPRHWRAVVGQHAILEALYTNPQWVEVLWLKPGYESSQDLKKLHSEFTRVVKGKIENKIEIKPEALLDRLASSNQGAALLMSQAPTLNLPELLSKAQSTVLLLDGIEDPHNLGAIVRTAWLQNVDAILLPQDRAVHLTPAVHKVACGGAEHVPVHVCTQVVQTLKELKEAGYWVYGLSHEGQQNIFSLKMASKVVWCVGAEDKGLRVSTAKMCDELVHIPQTNAAASYNASVAAGMALLETSRQHATLKQS